MRISKKILAIALSILMAVSMMPFTVFAATTVNTIDEFETALANASSGDTIQLGSDLDYSTTYTERNARDYGREHVVDLKDCTLDLNGHKISTINATVEFCGNGATIKNGTFALVPKNTDGTYKEGSYALIIDNNGKYGKTGTVTVNDVTCGGGINVCCATVELNNVTAASTPTKFYTVWAETDANVTINSGTYTDGQTGGKGVLATGTKEEGGATIEVKGGTFEASNKVVYNAEANSIKISGGTFSKEVSSAYLAEGAEYDATTGVVTQAYVAEVNGVKYGTFEEALAAISSVTTATHSKAKDPSYVYKTYVANGTIKLLANTTSNGVIIGSGSNLTIDFNGKTLDINAKPVGSNGTESSAMQLLKDSDITFKNGTLTSTYTYASTDKEYIQRLIQNYANLTLDHMTVGMRGNFKNQLMMSNSNGNITITDSTVSAPDFSWANYSAEQAAESLGARAMSVGSINSTAYPDVNVTVTNSTINGYVNIDTSYGPGTTAELTLTDSDVNGNIVDKDMTGATVKNIGSDVDGIPAGYEWNASNVLAPIADVFNLDIEDSINMNMYINTEAYADDATIEVTYSTPELNDKTAKTTDTISASTLPRDSQNRVKLTVNAAPAQITDDVVIKVKSGNQVVHTVTTSVRAYCEEIIAKSNNDKLVMLAKTMLDYGKAANRSFKYTEPSRFNYNNGEDYYDYYYGRVDLTAVLDKTGNNGVFASYSYIATTVPALRLYTNLSESQCGNADGVVTKATITNVTKGTTTQVAPVVVDLGDDNKVVAIDITGILAEDLADVYTVEYMGSTIKLNAIQFANAVKDTDRVDFGRAMFNYYVAANAYFK